MIIELLLTLNIFATSFIFIIIFKIYPMKIKRINYVENRVERLTKIISETKIQQENNKIILSRQNERKFKEIFEEIAKLNLFIKTINKHSLKT